MSRRQLRGGLIRSAVVSALAASLAGQLAHADDDERMGGSHENDHKTASPIKHLIVIVGENRSFDHVFATYQPPHGERVDNLLSKGIVNSDGSPGPNYSLAVQNSAVNSGPYSLAPGGKTPYNQTTNQLQAPGTSYAPQSCYTDVVTASLNGPGCMATLALAAQADYGLLPQDLPLLTEGATGLPGGSPDSRIVGYNNLPNGPYPLLTAQNGTQVSLYDTYGGSPVHRFYQMQQQLDCDPSHSR